MAKVEYAPFTVDRHGGKVLELVVRKGYMSRRWRVYARTESYGGRYMVPVAWEVSPGRKCRWYGWKLKRDALAYLATIQPVKE